MHYQKSGQFIGSKDSVAAIVAKYGINDFEFKPATSGIENSTFIITSPGGEYVLRVYRLGKKSVDDIQLEVSFTEMLRSEGLPVPEVLKNSQNAHVTSVCVGSQTWTAILMSHIEGEHKEDYTDVLINDLAEKQATMHNLGAEFAKEHPARNLLSTLREAEFIPQIALHEVSNTELKELLERGATYQYHLPSDLPAGYCHLDYDAENVLVNSKDRLVGILDFDDLAFSPIVVCLAYTLWAVLITADDEGAVKKYIEEYEEVRPLSAHEKESIAPIMLFRHYALAGLTTIRDEMDNDSLALYIKLEADIRAMNFEA